MCLQVHQCMLILCTSALMRVMLYAPTIHLEHCHNLSMLSAYGEEFLAAAACKAKLYSHARIASFDVLSIISCSI